MTIATAEGLVLRFIGPETGGVLHELLGLIVTRVVPIAITFSFFFLVYRVVPRRVVTTVTPRRARCWPPCSGSWRRTASPTTCATWRE